MFECRDASVVVEEAYFRDRVRAVDEEVQSVLRRTLPHQGLSMHGSFLAAGRNRSGLSYTTWHNASAEDKPLPCLAASAAGVTLTDCPSRTASMCVTSASVAPPHTLTGLEDTDHSHGRGTDGMHTLPHAGGLCGLPELQRMCVAETARWLDANLPAKLRDHIEAGVKRVIDERWMSQLQVVESAQAALQSTLDDLSRRWREQFGRMADTVDQLSRRVCGELNQVTTKIEAQSTALREEVMLLKNRLLSLETDARVGEQRTERRIDELTQRHHDQTRSTLAELQSHLFTWQSEKDAESSGQLATVRESCAKLEHDVGRLEGVLNRCVDTAEATVAELNELLGETAEQRSEVRVCRRDVNRLEMLVQCSADCCALSARTHSTHTGGGGGEHDATSRAAASCDSILVAQELLDSRESISFLSGQLASLERRVFVMEQRRGEGRGGGMVERTYRSDEDADSTTATSEDGSHERHTRTTPGYHPYHGRHAHRFVAPVMMHRRGGRDRRGSRLLRYPKRRVSLRHGNHDDERAYDAGAVRLRRTRDHDHAPPARPHNGSEHASMGHGDGAHRATRTLRSRRDTPPVTRVVHRGATTDSVDSVSTPPDGVGGTGQYVPAATSDTESERENRNLSRLPLD